MTRLARLLLLGMLALPVIASGAELFRDDFEDPSAKTWQRTWGPSAISAQRCHQGKRALKQTLENKHGYSVNYWDVAAQPNKLYAFSAYVFLPSNQPKRPTARLSINDKWHALAAATTSRLDHWVKLEASYFNVKHKTLRFVLMQAKHQAGIGGAVMFWDTVAATVKSGDEYMKELKGVNPSVLSGLDVSPAGGLSIKVDAGECMVGGKRVVVAAPATFTLDPCKTYAVRDEPHRLVADKPHSWSKGTRLEKCRGRGTTLPGCLVPGSVVVKLERDGEPLVKGKDYLVDETWGMLGRIERGRIGEKTKVYVDYSYSHARLDTVQVSPDGNASVRKGVGAKTCPIAPGADRGCLALANVFVNYNAQELTGFDIFPIGPPLPPPTAEELAKKAGRVPKARAKLAAGEKLLIGFWGDSVTCGGDVSRPERRFADGFVIDLRKRYPKARIDFFNAGIGGSNTRGRLPNLHADVISKKPDLVIIEFVNDMGFSPQMMREHYYDAIDQIRAIGAEVILITPHFTMPSMMGFDNVWGVDKRAACQALREIAAEKQVGLADAARVWQHLNKVGIPYTTLLFNGINHPDDRGHRIFIDELLKFF